MDDSLNNNHVILIVNGFSYDMVCLFFFVNVTRDIKNFVQIPNSFNKI